MGKKNTTTTSQTYSPTPQAAQAYSDILSRAQSVASTPYQAYTGELVSPVNAQQNIGIGNINANAGFALPYIQQAAGLATAGATPLTAGQIQNYQDPYTQSVVNATQNQFNQQNAQQQSALLGNAISQGALGGNRVGVAQANLAQAQQTAQAPVIAGLYNQGYQTALNTALAEQQAQAMGAYSLGNLGVAGEQAALTGAGAQLGAGTLQQQTQQAQDTAAYNQYLQQLGFPYQQTQWLAGLATGVGSQMGGTSSGVTSGPAPNQTGQYLGAGLTALGFFLNKGGRVKHLATGGNSISGFAPYGGATSWIPSIGMATGSTIPKGSSPSNPNSTDSTNYNDLGKSLGSDLSKLSAGFINSPMSLNAPGIAGFSPSAVGTMYSPVDLTGSFSPLGLGSLNAIFAKGGKVKHFDDGGDVAGFAPSDFSAPFAGTTMSDLMPIGAGLPIDTVPSAGFGPLPDAGPTFNERFSGVGTPTSIANDVLPSGGNLPINVAPAAGFGPSAIPLTGTQAITAPETTDIARPTQDYQYNIDRGLGIIRNMETGGQRDPYGYVGAATIDKSGVAHRPIGAYGIMDFNVGPWTQAVLGRAMTPQEFLGNQEAQDAIARAKFGQYMNQYGPEGAARAWLGGEHGMWNTNARDVLGTSVGDYGRKFMTAWNGPAGGPTAGVGGSETLPPNAQPARYSANAPQSTTESQQSLLSGLGLNLSPDARMALISAGLGMMASQSPYLGTQIGQGGLAGLQTYTNMQQLHMQQAFKEQQLQLEAAKMAQQAQLAQLPYEHLTAAQQAQPVKIGQGMFGDVYAVRDPSAPGGFRPINVPGTVNFGGQPGTAGGEPNIHGDAFLKTLDPSMASQVEALAQGRLAFPSGFALKSPYWQTMLRMVSQYDPSFDAVNYQARSRARTDATSGKLAQTNNALNTGIGHLNQLADAVASLHNMNWQFGNRVKNWLSEEFGGTGPTNFDAIKNRVAPEIVKIWRGTGGSEADIKRDIDSLSNAKTPAQLYGAIYEIANLMQSKIEANEAQYSQAMGPHGLPLQMITPQSQSTLTKLEHLRNGESPMGSQPTSIPSAAQRQVGQVYNTPKGPAKWMGNGWQLMAQ